MSDVAVISPASTENRDAAPKAQPPHAAEHPKRVSGGGIALLMAYLVATSVLLLYSLVVLWPAPVPAGGTAPATASINYLFWTFSVTDEARLLLLVALAGALGTLIHALRSFYWYVGNKNLMQSWVAMYLLLPFSGTSLALAFYLVIRGGFFSPQATVQQTSPFGFVALAVLVGMFSQQAVLKLKDVAETVLTKPKPGDDNKPQDSEPVIPSTRSDRDAIIPVVTVPFLPTPPVNDGGAGNTRPAASGAPTTPAVAGNGNHAETELVTVANGPAASQPSDLPPGN